jgi:hypothetical protein
MNKVDPIVQQQIDYNDRISSRSFVQSNQKASFNVRDKNMVKMPKNNDAFLDDRSFTAYNIRGSQTQNVTSELQHKPKQNNDFGPYAQFQSNEKLPSSQNIPKKNVDLEYDMRMPVNQYNYNNDHSHHNNDKGHSLKNYIHPLDRKGRREYEHNYVMSSLKN